MLQIKEPKIRSTLDQLHQLKGTPVTLMPEVTFVKIKSQRGDQYLSLIANRAYSSLTSMFRQQKNRLPAEDTLSVIPGFIGAYPNTFHIIDERELGDFVDSMNSLETKNDYERLLDKFAVRRTDINFWSHSDLFQQAYAQNYPLSSGVLDFSRLENR